MNNLRDPKGASLRYKIRVHLFLQKLYYFSTYLVFNCSYIRKGKLFHKYLYNKTTHLVI